MDKDDAIKILDACGLYTEIGISILRERCLLKIDGSNGLRMHNLIRDMGREIVREESLKHPRMRSRLWFHNDAYDVLKKFKGHENIEGIRLVMPMQEEVDISTRAFHSLPNLRLLQISNVNLIGSFENLFENLRWFCWYDSSLDCLPSSFQAPKLIFLDMQHSKVKILWEGTKQLQSLKILNASESQFLKTTPDFKGLKSLEKLILQHCSSLSRIHPSIGLLHKLVNLDLSECYSLNQLPEKLGNMGCLRELNASWLSIEQLPDSIGHLGKLEKLDLVWCKNLRNLPSSICDLTSLTYLNLFFCSNLESLPENLGCLTRLKHLDMFDCKRLRNTPRSIYNLSSLETLTLCDRSDDGDNFYGIESLSSLKMLRLTNEYFNSLPSNLSQLVNLEELYVSHCSSLQSLPECPPNLEKLFACRCTSLYKLPNLSRMNNLRTLDFSECGSLQSLPKLPPNLRYLDLDKCWSLQFLPELPLSLQTLALNNCTSLRSLPKFVPRRLRELYLNNCSSLESLPELPPDLHKLDLSNCNRLLSLPKLPPILEHLSLINWTSLRSLPKLPCKLENLDLSDCSSLKSLQELPCHLYSLNASGCKSLQKLPDLSKLKYLRTLVLTDCSNLISNFIWSFLQDCSGFGGCDVYLPSRVIQDWFSHQRTGSSTSFQMPGDVKSNFLGMAFWVAFSGKLDSVIVAVITNETDGTQFEYCGYVQATGVHAWVRSIGKPISMKSGDRIEVSFRGTEDVTVEMCGVHFDC